jgi:teichuronic acid biosynthesis glycosyltransferase TuaG
MPRLSILIPVYNAEKFISKTIDSVLAQTYTDWELIIVEDKSTDKSFDVLKQYEAQYPEKIKVFQNEANLGMLLNWNTGIDLCKSELLFKPAVFFIECLGFRNNINYLLLNKKINKYAF